MRSFRPPSLGYWLGAAAVAATTQGWAQDPSTLEPRWLRLAVSQASLGVETEVLRENYSVYGSDSTHKYYFVTPLVGLQLDGSVYHPNFMSFNFLGEGGAGWGQDSVISPGSTITRDESQRLVRYVATINFLSGKPYNATFFANQDHNYSNFDFFNTAVVDSLRYGGRLAWSAKSFNLGLEMGHRQQEASGLTGTSFIADDYINFNGLSQRARGSSLLNYNYDNYQNWLDNGPTQNGTSQSVNASDSETLGHDGRVVASAGLGYSRADYTAQNTETVNANANVTAKHSDTLDSFYSFNYVDTQQNPATTTLYQGMVGLRHQLYESLSSAVDFHGSFTDLSSPTGSGKNNLYGGGLRETYNKRLGEWGRLSLGGAVILDHQDNQSDGSILSVINEAHVISDIVPATLKNPRVLVSTIVVTGPSGAPIYRQGADYQVIQVGELTQILRNPTSLDLPNNSPILVSYESASLYTASFDTLNGSVSIRLDLFNCVGVYGRYNSVGNNAPADIPTENLADYAGGADFTWRWLRAGAEYEDYNSNFAEYHATRLFQSLNFQPADALNLGFDFNQVWYRYPDNPQEVQYRFMTRLDTQLTSWLSWNVEGGYYLREAMNVQQNLAAARTALNFTWGKLTIRTGYQYNYELTQDTGLLARNFFYLHLRRIF